MNLDQWDQALTADGWQRKPIYGEQDKSAEFKRDGYIVQIYQPPHSSHVSAWGPDKLSIDLTDDYDFAAMQSAMLVCSKCGVIGKTVGVGFAGRVCPECRKELAPKIEYRGWCN